MKKKLTQWYQKTFIHKLMQQRHYKWVKKNNGVSVHLLRDTIVYQMRAGGVSYEMINRWLAATNQPTIKYLGFKHGTKDVMLFYSDVPADKRPLYKEIRRVA